MHPRGLLGAYSGGQPVLVRLSGGWVAQPQKGGFPKENRPFFIFPLHFSIPFYIYNIIIPHIVNKST